jgi:hypothetical protein
MRRFGLRLLCTLAWGATPALPPAASAGTPPPDSAIQVQYRMCERRAGPYATQDTAWARRNQAQGMGYSVSGVFPCWEDGARGYCFNAFLPC